jgi:hypothetical protein
MTGLFNLLVLFAEEYCLFLTEARVLVPHKRLMHSDALLSAPLLSDNARMAVMNLTMPVGDVLPSATATGPATSDACDAPPAKQQSQSGVIPAPTQTVVSDLSSSVPKLAPSASSAFAAPRRVSCSPFQGPASSASRQTNATECVQMQYTAPCAEAVALGVEGLVRLASGVSSPPASTSSEPDRAPPGPERTDLKRRRSEQDDGEEERDAAGDAHDDSETQDEGCVHSNSLVSCH